jgi:hypothetical protein
MVEMALTIMVVVGGIAVLLLIIELAADWLDRRRRELSE